METHTLPAADSPKGLTSVGVSTVSLPLGVEWHPNPDPAWEHTSGTWKRSAASQRPVPAALPNWGPKGSLDAFFCQKLLATL